MLSLAQIFFVMVLPEGEYIGRERLEEHVVRILDHLPDLNRARFQSVGEYIENVSRLVKDLYKVKYLEPPAAPEILSLPETNWTHLLSRPISISTSLQNAEIDAVYFGQCGEGFTAIVWHYIQLCLRELAIRLEEISPPPRRIRFWGRILGTDAEFYIFEVQVQDGFKYQVACGDSLFRELPPSSVELLREFQRYPCLVRGTLSCPSTLQTLSTIVAHVSGDSVISLQDQLTDELTVNPEFELSTVRSVCDTSKWVHARRPAIAAAVESNELFARPLTESEWAVSDCGGVTLLRSLKWSGYSMVCFKGRTAQMYNGLGVPSTDLPIFQETPPEIQENKEDGSDL